MDSWIAGLRPAVDVLALEVDSGGRLTRLHLNVWVEPALQVRMTGRSAGYMPRAVAYNAWKRVVSHHVKEALRLCAPGLRPLPGLVRATMRFHVSDPHRWHLGDLNNYVKATEDMLNQCKHPYTDGERERWPDMTDPLPVWVDDRKVRRNGEGQGVYWTERNPRVEIELEHIELPGPAAKGRK